MKSILFSLTTFLLTTISIYAQNEMSVGAGAGFSTWGNSSPNTFEKNRLLPSYSATFRYQHVFEQKMFVGALLNFSQKGSLMIDKDSIFEDAIIGEPSLIASEWHLKYKFQFLNLGTYVGYQFNISDKFSLSPYLGVFGGLTYKRVGIVEYEVADDFYDYWNWNNKNKIDFKNRYFSLWDVGILLGLDAKYHIKQPHFIFISAQYQQGVHKIAEDKQRRNSSLLLEIGYGFIFKN